MGRAVPAYGNVNIDRILLSYAFFAAGVAATLSIIIAIKNRQPIIKNRQPITGRKEPTTDNKENLDKTESDDVSGENPGPATTDQSQDTPSGDKELPLPPGSKLRGSQSTVLRSNSEKPTLMAKKLRFTMSMNKAKPSIKDANFNTKDKNAKRDDSIWMKPIILGEKCRVPGNNASEGEGDDDKAIINVDGSMIASTNFRNHSRQFTVSKNNDFVDKNNNVVSNSSS